MSPDPRSSRVIRLVEEKLSPEARGWLEAARGADLDALVMRLAEAPRRVAGVLEVASSEDVGWIFRGPAAEALRCALLLSAAAPLADAAVAPLWSECFRLGDNGEKRAVLRVLALGPQSEDMVLLGVMGCRTNVRDVFEAIACDNPYPADRFPDPNFNQMVLKALFVGVPLARITGLERRITPELSRMAEGYASERRAAGRSVPADIHTVTGTEETR